MTQKLMSNKWIKLAAEEKYVLYAYVVLYLVNHVVEFFFDVWLRPLFAILYLWVLAVYVYHTVVTKKYFSDLYYRMAQIFLIMNLISSFIYKANWRFSILQDFAILILYLFICFGAFHEKKDQGMLEKVLWILLAYTFVTSAASFIARGFVPSLLKEINESRFRGFYTYYNDGANYAYTSILFSLYLIIHDRGKHSHLTLAVLFLINLVLQLMYMYLTKARTYLLVLAVSLFILGMYALQGRIHDRRKRTQMYVMITVAFLIVGYIMMFTRYGIARNFATYSYQGKTFADFGMMTSAERDDFLNHFTSKRYVMWKECFEVIGKSPIIGYGLKSRGFTYFSAHGENAHNIFINSLLFSGVLGFIWTVVFFGKVLLDSAKNCHSFDRIILWSFVLGTFLIAQLETGLLYNGKATSAICWAVMGFLTAEYGKIPVKQNKTVIY